VKGKDSCSEGRAASWGRTCCSERKRRQGEERKRERKRREKAIKKRCGYRRTRDRGGGEGGIGGGIGERIESKLERDGKICCGERAEFRGRKGDRKKMKRERKWELGNSADRMEQNSRDDSDESGQAARDGE